MLTGSNQRSAHSQSGLFNDELLYSLKFQSFQFIQQILKADITTSLWASCFCTLSTILNSLLLVV